MECVPLLYNILPMHLIPAVCILTLLEALV